MIHPPPSPVLGCKDEASWEVWLGPDSDSRNAAGQYKLKLQVKTGLNFLQEKNYCSVTPPIHSGLQLQELPCYTGRGVSLVAQWVKNPPATLETQESQVQSLGWEDPIEEGMAIHSSILTWRIP